MNNFNDSNTIHYPYVTFTIKGEQYCISSKHVLQMVIKSKLVEIPGASDFMSGILHIRGENYPIMDLRLLINMDTLESEISAFGVMKDKHLEWVRALEKSIKDGSEFLLARDPHKCSFGLWYDEFKSENNSINRILEKINEPHKEMHQQASIIDECKRKNDTIGINSAFDRAQHLCHQIIVPLLDSLIEAYASANKGMVILMNLDDKKMGILVDNITSIETFLKGNKEPLPNNLQNNEYFKNIIISNDDTLFLEFDEQALFELAENANNEIKLGIQ